MNNLEIVKLEHIFKTLGNRKRLALLVYLVKGEASINRLCVALSIPYKTADRNLLRLQESGFLTKRTANGQAFFSINDKATPHYDFMLKLIIEACQKLDVEKLAKSLLKSADYIASNELRKIPSKFGIKYDV